MPAGAGAEESVQARGGAKKGKGGGGGREGVDKGDGGVSGAGDGDGKSDDGELSSNQQPAAGLALAEWGLAPGRVATLVKALLKFALEWGGEEKKFR